MILDKKSYPLDNLFFLLIANSSYFGGGIMIWSTASTKKKEIGLVYFENGSFFQRVQSLLSMVLKKHELSPTIRHLTRLHVVLKSNEKLLLQMDGEITTANEVSLIYQERSMYL
ncbi:TPA: hypothetical protein ACGORE_000787 [Streptococcus suis]